MGERQEQASTSVAARPQRADARRNYEAILVAARRLAATNPEEIVLEQVARGAGVGIGTLYRHFPTRLALLEAAHRSEVEDLAAQADALARDLEPLPALETWVRLVSSYISTKKALLREQQAARASSSTVPELRDVMVGAARMLLDRAQSAGLVRGDIDGSDLLRLVGGCSLVPTDNVQQRELMVDVVLAGLRR